MRVTKHYKSSSTKGVKIHPKEKVYEISKLEEEISQKNALELNSWLNDELEIVQEKSLLIDSESEAVSTSLIVNSDLIDLEIKKKFLSKIDIASCNNANHHYLVLEGLVHNRRLEILNYALELGFDPSATNHEALDQRFSESKINEQISSPFFIAVSQCQWASRSDAQISFIDKAGLEKDDHFKDKREKDFEMIKSMLRTGKIDGFFKERGVEEAKKIDQILNGQNLPADIGFSKPAAGEHASITRQWRGNQINITFDDNPHNMVRTHISSFYYQEREKKEAINNAEVRSNFLDEELENKKAPSTKLTIGQSLFSCFSQLIFGNSPIAREEAAKSPDQKSTFRR